MIDDEVQKIIKGAADILMNAVLGIIQGDPHGWSSRPCESCRTISGIIGKPFGCYKYQEIRKKNKDSEKFKKSIDESV